MEEIIEVQDEKNLPSTLNNDYFQKSNFLISAKYRSTLLENKLLMLGLANIKKNDQGELVTEMRASYLRQMIQDGKKNGSFYDQLYDTSLRMTSRQFVIQDENGFDIFHLTPRAKYEKGNGIFTIYWEKGLEQYLYMVKKNYTNLSIGTFMKFKSVFSFRLYEILKSKMYVPKYYDKDVAVNDFFKIEMSIAELKLDMGAVDASEPNVQRILTPKNYYGEQPDYEKAVSIAKSKNYEGWHQFKTCCLDKGIAEINEKTDIDVSYDTIRSGRGGKVTDVIFYVSKTDTPKKQKELSEDEKMDFYYSVADIIDERLKLKDLSAIAEASGYDMKKIKRAYEYAKSSPTDKDNLVGYLIAAIKGGYGDKVKSKGIRKAPNHNFTARTYDYHELENNLLTD